MVFVSCDDYDFDEENYVPLHLETTLKDNWHTTIGYAYETRYDMPIQEALLKTIITT